MHYTIYKISNKIDGKVYIGSHKTKNLDDAYMGSGKYLKRAQEKYGIENFTKEILFIYDTSDEMYAKEAELVNEDFLALENTYNIKIGGYGGWDYLNKRHDNPTHSVEHMTMMSNKVSIETKRRCAKIANRKYKELFESNGNKIWWTPAKGFLGKTHTEEVRKSIGEKNSKHQNGIGNSQFGTMWITNEKENIKISKTDSIPDGWKKGRIFLKKYNV
jgi:group I intron endonuclease